MLLSHTHTVSQSVISPATPYTHHMRTGKGSSSTSAILDSLVSKPIIGTAPLKTMEIMLAADS